MICWFLESGIGREVNLRPRKKCRSAILCDGGGKDIAVNICLVDSGLRGDQGAGNGRSWVSAKIGGFTSRQTKVGYFLITSNPNIHCQPVFNLGIRLHEMKISIWIFVQPLRLTIIQTWIKWEQALSEEWNVRTWWLNSEHFQNESEERD